MNQLATGLSASDLRRGDELAARFNARKWQSPATQAIPTGDPRLKLSGITTGRNRLAIINGKTLAEGESVTVSIPNGTLHVKCQAIGTNSVTVIVEGEQTPRVLRLEQ